MTSIVIVTSYYYPESGAAAKRLTSLAEYLVEKNHNVTVITLLPNYPHNKIFPGYDTKTHSFSVERGVKIIRVKPFLVPKDNYVLRILSEIIFCVKALPKIIKLRPDIIIASSPFIFLGPTGYIASKILKKPFIWDVRDLTWLSPRAIGKKTFGFDLVLDLIMKSVAKQASALISPCEGILMHFPQKASLSKVIPNGVSEELIENFRNFNSEKRIITKRPKVVYAGLFGYLQDFDIIIKTAELMPDVDFVLVGDGPEKERISRQSERITNIKLLPFLPFDKLLEIYEEADILIATLKKSPLNKIAQPSKVWEYLLTGKPVIFCGEGDMAQLLVENNIAWVVAPGDVASLKETINSIISDYELAKAKAMKGKEFVIHKRRRKTIYEELENLIMTIVKNGGN
ncbi:MAG: glycosyltransferase family 4 protein [candidate division WOR-3 bacterium]